MKKASAKKHRRPSLAVQVNILIILITLSISILMVVINISNYHKAILDPFERKLEELEIEEDTLTPYLEYFARFFGTEEMRKARASVNTEDDHFVDWLDQMPSYTDYDSEGRQSLLLDNTAFDFTISELMESIDLDLVCSEIVKDGEVTASLMPRPLARPRVKVVLPAPTSPSSSITSGADNDLAIFSPNSNICCSELTNMTIFYHIFGNYLERRKGR